ncbi:MAG: NAD(P)/FAD-dependent oxidoreductase [Turicibacter sp.]|nr:NAD(P)/FAD-dependent oxidoreductase [Turicibacter sp.]
MAEKIYDMTIIGGGPVGIYGAFYGGMQGLEINLVDSLPQLGGQLAALYPEKFIYDLPGHSKIRAGEMVEQLVEQMDNYGERINKSIDNSVQNIERLEDRTFRITTDKDVHIARSILVTAGNGAFSPRKLDGDTGEFSNIHYFVPKMDEFQGKNVVIFGGGDSAVDWALMLEPIAKSVTIVHRRNEFRAHASSVDKLKASTVNVVTPAVVSVLTADNGKVSKVAIENVDTKEVTEYECDDIIALFGFVSSLGPIKTWGLELDKTALKVDSKYQTNLEGVYAAGDAASFDGKIKMITAGFGEAVVAINAAKAYAYPDRVHRHQHSSNIAK